MLRKIRFIPENYVERYGNLEWHIPEGVFYFPKVCYEEDGSPVAFKLGEPFIIKVGKRRFAKVIINA